MFQNPLVKEMVGMFKGNVENSLQAMSMIQEQSEKVTRLLAEQAASVQGEGKKFLEQWADAVKKQQQDYQQQWKSQMEKLEQFLDKSGK